MNNASNGEVDSRRIYTRLKPSSSLFPTSSFAVKCSSNFNSPMRTFHCNHCSGLKICHWIRMLFKHLKVSRFLILIWLLIPFIFANDSYARNGEPRMESFEGSQSPTRTQRDNSGIIVQNQNISMKSFKHTPDDVRR